MSDYRLLITGSRDWPDTPRIHGALDAVLNQMDPGETLVIVHGAATRGADQIARRWAAYMCVPEDAHTANWDRDGRAAGMIRNKAMVDAGAAMCFAWIMPCSQPGCRNPEPHGSHGECSDPAGQSCECPCHTETGRLEMRVSELEESVVIAYAIVSDRLPQDRSGWRDWHDHLTGALADDAAEITARRPKLAEWYLRPDHKPEGA